MAKKASGKPSRAADLFKPYDPPPEVIRALYPDEPAVPAPPPERNERKRPRRLGWQIRRALAPLPKLYPPDGKVPDDVQTEVVRGQVNTELASDTENKGKAEISWDTMNRALGRDPRK